jgi:hypothetical protein
VDVPSYFQCVLVPYVSSWALHYHRDLLTSDTQSNGIPTLSTSSDGRYSSGRSSSSFPAYYSSSSSSSFYSTWGSYFTGWHQVRILNNRCLVYSTLEIFVRRFSRRSLRRTERILHGYARVDIRDSRGMDSHAQQMDHGVPATIDVTACSGCCELLYFCWDLVWVVMILGPLLDY